MGCGIIAPRTGRRGGWPLATTGAALAVGYRIGWTFGEDEEAFAFTGPRSSRTRTNSSESVTASTSTLTRAPMSGWQTQSGRQRVDLEVGSMSLRRARFGPPIATVRRRRTGTIGSWVACGITSTSGIPVGVRWSLETTPGQPSKRRRTMHTGAVLRRSGAETGASSKGRSSRFLPHGSVQDACRKARYKAAECRVRGTFTPVPRPDKSPFHAPNSGYVARAIACLKSGRGTAIRSSTISEWRTPTGT